MIQCARPRFFHIKQRSGVDTGDISADMLVCSLPVVPRVHHCRVTNPWNNCMLLLRVYSFPFHAISVWFMADRAARACLANLSALTQYEAGSGGSDRRGKEHIRIALRLIPGRGTAAVGMASRQNG